MNANSQANAALKWRNRAALLELGIANEAVTEHQKGILTAGQRLQNERDCNDSDPNTRSLIRPKSCTAPKAFVPNTLIRPSYLRIDKRSTQPPVLVSIIRALGYEAILQQPAPRGTALRLHNQLIPDDPEKRWRFAMDELTGPRWLEADLTPVKQALQHAPENVRSLAEGVINNVESQTQAGWLPEDLQWMERCTGARAEIKGVNVFSEIQEAVPAAMRTLPERLNRSHLNVAYGWWLESVIASHDTPSGLTHHWVTLLELQRTVDLAITLATQGFKIIAFGMGMVAIERPDAGMLRKLQYSALENQAQLLSSQEGRLRIPDSIAPADVSDVARPALIYSRLLATSNATQITRLFKTDAPRGPGPIGDE